MGRGTNARGARDISAASAIVLILLHVGVMIGRKGQDRPIVIVVAGCPKV